MKGKGFSLEVMNEGGAIMAGKFIGKNVKLGILTTKVTGIVYVVRIDLPEDQSWRSLKYDYESIKQQYIIKYGEPLTIEYFLYPYDDGDEYGHEITALKNDKCTFISVWEDKNGEITLNIGDNCSIIIWYIDTINREKREKEKNSQIQDEI